MMLTQSTFKEAWRGILQSRIHAFPSGTGFAISPLTFLQGLSYEAKCNQRLTFRIGQHAPVRLHTLIILAAAREDYAQHIDFIHVNPFKPFHSFAS